MPQPDRHPGTREEDEIYLVPGADSPTQNGHVTYKTGEGFRLYQEGAERGLGLLVSEHKSLDILLHELSENHYLEVTRSAGKVANVICWNSSSKTKKVREVAITRTSGRVSQIDIIQYDESGVESVRMTGDVSRSGGRVTSIDWTETTA